MKRAICAAALTILIATPSFAGQACQAKLVQFSTGSRNARVFVNPCNIAFLKENLDVGANKTRINFIGTGDQQLDVNEDISAVAAAINAASTVGP